MKFKMLELEEKIWADAGTIYCSPANLTVRKIRDEVNSPPSVQAPVDDDRYQGVVTQWYSPLSLHEYTQIVWIDDWALFEHAFLPIFNCYNCPKHSPILNSMYIQQVCVGVLAFDWNVTGWVTSFFPHNAKAVDARYLDGRLSAT